MSNQANTLPLENDILTCSKGQSWKVAVVMSSAGYPDMAKAWEKVGIRCQLGLTRPNGHTMYLGNMSTAGKLYAVSRF